MEKKFKRTTVTSALPYANGPVHIGHLAGVYVPADIYVRYLRLKKEDVIFIGGSDEHGVPITIRAKKEGVTPQDIVDRYHTLIKESFKEFGISFDVYSRTSSKTHHDTASEFFRKLYDKGDFIEKTIHTAPFLRLLLRVQEYPNQGHGLPHGVAGPCQASFCTDRIHWDAILYDLPESIGATSFHVGQAADTNASFRALRAYFR